MAFVIPDGEKAYRACRQLTLSLGYPYTMLAGKQAEPVLVLPDPVLDELTDRRIGFTVIPEALLAEHLSPPGYALYRHLRAHQSHRLYFNAPLPPANHVVLSCNVPEAHLEALRQIVEHYAPVAFRTADVILHAVHVDSDHPPDHRPMVKAEFIVPRRYRQALTDAILASGTAGFSPETAVIVISDADGPPRSAAEGRSR